MKSETETLVRFLNVSVKPHRVFTKPQKRGKIVPGGLEKSQDFPGFFKKAEGQE